jgi:hypothetical protein
MPSIQVSISGSIQKIEKKLGMPESGSRDAEWLNQLAQVINQANGTDISIDRQGWADYSTPNAAFVLKEFFSI